MTHNPRGMKAFLGIVALLGAAAFVVAQNKIVDDKALRDAAKNKEEWISYNRDWQETRYSPLDQINTTNVKTLGLAWSYDIPSVGAGARQEGTPLVSNGVLYSITPWSVVYAVDARTGKEKWKVDPQVNQSIIQSRICCGVVNRGIALYKNKLIVPVVDGRMRALDIETGKVIWEMQLTPKNESYTLTMAPRVIKGGRVIMGAAGGEYAVRGFFSAINVETGKEQWRFYTVPGNPSKPFEQPVYASWAKTWEPKFWETGLGGGGPVWGSIAYDEDNDLVYVGTGQPGPWTSYHRGSGDNLCTNCILAVKGATGKYVWHYQTTPGDDWDYDSIADISLVDLNIGGRTRKALVHAPKNGFVFVLDRVTGEYISATPWVPVSWATGVDSKGRIKVNPAAVYGTTAIRVTPGPGGGHVWPPQSFNPKTGLLYIPSTAGGEYSYGVVGDFQPQSTIVGDEGRGLMQMGTGGIGGGGRGAGGRGGTGGAPRGAAPGGGPGGGPAGAPRGPAPGAGAPPARGAGAELFQDPQFDVQPSITNVAFVQQGPGGGPGGAAGRGGPGGIGGAPGAGRGGPGGGPGAAPGGAAGGGGRGGPAGGGGGGLATIGPAGRGSILVAWNPATGKEAWRGPAGTSAGFNAGGTLSTAGNLVFTHVSDTLFAFNAATGEQVASIATGLGASPGPPITFMLDGVQYVAIAGAPGGGGGRGGGPGGGARLETPQPTLQNVAFVQGPPAGGAGGGGGRGGPGGGTGRGGPAGGGVPGGTAAGGPQASQAKLLVLKLGGAPLVPVAAQTAPAAPTPGGNAAVAPAPAPAADPSAAEIKQLSEAACSGCHDFGLVAEKRLSRDDWANMVQYMVDRGAYLTKEQLPKVIEYLFKTYPNK